MGDIESINYMLYLNKKKGQKLFDFTLTTKDTGDSVYHLAARHDQYHIVDSLANSSANILLYNNHWLTARQVSCHTLILISTLVKIESKTVKGISCFSIKLYPPVPSISV